VRRVYFYIMCRRTIYNLFLNLIWNYDIQLWDSAKKSNTNKIQIFQSKVLQLITNAPLNVSNLTLHNDQKVPFIKDVTKQHYSKFNSHLHQYTKLRIPFTSKQSSPKAKTTMAKGSSLTLTIF